MLNAHEFISHYHYAGILALLLMGGIGLPFPEDATLILTGFLISAGEIRPVHALATVYVGLIISDMTLYWGGRRYGGKVLAHRFFSRVASPRRLEWAEEKFRRYGSLVILLGRNIPGVRAQIILASGVLKMPFLKFLLTDAAAMIVTMSIMVGLGYTGGKNLPRVPEFMRDLGHVAFIAALAFIAAYGAYRLVKARRERTRAEEEEKAA